MLAVIPARIGSKAVARKNIRSVGGRPLVAWTIDAARSARSVSRVVVSTDSEEIGEVARREGAEVPTLRPSELAGDDTPGIEPIIHMVRWLAERERYQTEFVVTLQPTSPLRTAQDIDRANELARERSADAVVSVVLSPHHPAWLKRVTADGLLADYDGSIEPAATRQQLEPTYVLNGALYLTRSRVLLARRSFYAERTYAYVMPPERSLDIDTEWDMYVAGLALDKRSAEGRTI